MSILLWKSSNNAVKKMGWWIARWLDRWLRCKMLTADSRWWVWFMCHSSNFPAAWKNFVWKNQNVWRWISFCVLKYFIHPWAKKATSAPAKHFIGFLSYVNKWVLKCHTHLLHPGTTSVSTTARISWSQELVPGTALITLHVLVTQRN